MTIKARAPNPSCCSDPRYLCDKCAAQVAAETRNTAIDPVDMLLPPEPVVVQNVQEQSQADPDAFLPLPPRTVPATTQQQQAERGDLLLPPSTVATIVRERQQEQQQRARR